MSDIETAKTLEKAKTLFLEGLEFLDSRDFVNAELRFREALKFAPKSVPVLTNLAAALFAQEKLDEALDYAEQGTLSDAKNIEAHLIIANCFAKKNALSKRWPVAIR